MALFAFRRLSLGDSYLQNINCLSTWITDPNLNHRLLAQASFASDRFLLDAIAPQSIFAIVSQANRKRKHKLSAKMIELALRINADIENFGLRFQIRVFRLKSLADRAFRVLHAQEETMHVRDITRQINHLLVLDNEAGHVPIRSVQSQMAGDPRFQPIGRSGKWGTRNLG